MHALHSLHQVYTLHYVRPQLSSRINFHLQLTFKNVQTFALRAVLKTVVAMVETENEHNVNHDSSTTSARKTRTSGFLIFVRYGEKTSPIIGWLVCELQTDFVQPSFRF